MTVAVTGVRMLPGTAQWCSQVSVKSVGAEDNTSKYYVTVFTLKIFGKESKTDPIYKNPTHGKFVIQ